MFCIKCGSQNPDSSSFCQRCGAPMITGNAAQSQAPQPVKKAKEKKPRKVRSAPPPASVGTKILTIFLCVCFSLFFLLAGTVGLVRELLQEESLEHTLEETDFDEIEITAGGESYSLPEYIHENLTEEAQAIFSKKAIRNALEDKEVREFLVDALLGYTEYFTDGERMKTIDAKDIADFIDKKIDDLSDGEIRHLSQQEYDSLVENLESSFDFDQLSLSGLRKNTGVNPSLLQFVLSPLCYWLLFAVCVIFFVLVLLVNRSNLCSCVPKLSVTFIVLGVLYLLLALGCVYFILFAPVGFLRLLAPLFGQIASFYAMRGGIGFVLGLFGSIMSKLLRKREQARSSSCTC